MFGMFGMGLDWGWMGLGWWDWMGGMSLVGLGWTGLDGVELDGAGAV